MQKFSFAVLDFMKDFVPGEDILFGEQMKDHTTFRIGGEVACFVKISKAEQLIKLIPYLKELDVPYFILGNGSNLLVSDKGYDGLILQVADKFARIESQGSLLKVQSGALLSQVARYAMEHSLSGLEFASGIPGTIGGSVVMNAGAYEGEMEQVVQSVTVLNDKGEILELDKSTMEFGYRTSIIKNRNFIVLEVTLKMQEGVQEEILAKMEDLSQKRREKQPLAYPSAGSTFKRPEGHYAGKLIMESGLRGYSIGGAKVSEKHCGFVINTGNATAYDVAEVIKEVQDRVKDRFGVILDREVIYLGEF